MPHRIKTPYSNPLPSELQTSPPTRNSQYQLSFDEWTAKNARAKAIIMSTLVPHSEAWKIAEPLEYASDIWKALEVKYGPKDGTNNMWHPGTQWVKNQEVVAAATEVGYRNTTAEPGQNQQPISTVANDRRLEGITGSVGLQAHTDRNSSPTEPEIDQERRDRRFLWALLNGGKDKLDTVTIHTGQQLCGL